MHTQNSVVSGNRFLKYLTQLRGATTVAVVGNGPIDPSKSGDIDSHDLVVRFNACPNFGATGYRIDQLILTNTGEPARQFAYDPHALNDQALRGARSILLARPPRLVTAERLRFPEDRDFWISFDSDLIQNRIGYKPWAYMAADIYPKARAVLMRYGARASDQPSTGILALFHLARRLRRRIRSSSVTLYGFTHQGWERHPWDAERDLIDDRWKDWIRRA